MNPVWGMLLAMAALLVVFRLKNRKKTGKIVRKVYARRIAGFQVNAFLRPEIGNGCLFDHGIQYGKGFRRKEGPQLPHDEFCDCSTNPFSYTSTEVFNGALRDIGGVRSTIPGLSHEVAAQLIESMKQLNGLPLAALPEDYLASFDTGRFGEALRPAIKEFVLARHRFLKEHETKVEGAGDEGVEESEMSGRHGDSTGS